MGRYTEAKCRLCRREGEKLFLKGERCSSEKCSFARRSYAPGQHGKVVTRRSSEYRIRLREKQKARRIYGLTERQFENYFNKASETKGATSEKLLEYLERRLDNVVFRLGFVSSRSTARQIVKHGHILINGKKVDVPSFQVKVDNVVKAGPKMEKPVKELQEKFADKIPPVWLSLTSELEGKVVAIPKREEIDTVLEDHLIVEYYSR